MRREPREPRTGWQERLEAIGFNYHSMGGTYWDESACYRLDEREVDELEAVTETLHALCLEVVEFVIREDQFERLGIDRSVARLVESSWRQHHPSVYGRLDLVCQAGEPPKLLEYNADTPTALFEASVAQWFWLQDVEPQADQFNSIHEKLIARWRVIAEQLPRHDVLYFACMRDYSEDLVTTEYLRDTASQAGIRTKHIHIEDIGTRAGVTQFFDLNQLPIETVFKLYPWEWMLAEEFGPRLLEQPWRIIEPPWKLLLSNKGILPLLWEQFPRHPNLLPAYFKSNELGASYVSKPFYSREGANVSIVDAGRSYTSQGPYVREPLIYQAYCPLPVFDGNHMVVGSWIVGDAAAGIGIREDSGPITQNTSRFVPHYFV